MKNLNKTIFIFYYKNQRYEVDWLTDATCQPDEMVCDIFDGKGRNSKCVGNMVLLKVCGPKLIKKYAIETINENLI